MSGQLPGTCVKAGNSKFKSDDGTEATPTALPEQHLDDGGGAAQEAPQLREQRTGETTATAAGRQFNRIFSPKWQPENRPEVPFQKEYMQKLLFLDNSGHFSCRFPAVVMFLIK